MATPAPIYLDNHATTPVDPRVAAEMNRIVRECYGNANSAYYRQAESARGVVQAAKQAVATLAGSDTEDILFTSGATESIRIALDHAVMQVRGRPLRVLCTRIEHRAVLVFLERMSFQGTVEVAWLDVPRSGVLQEETLADAARAGSDLACIMAANNEIGTIQDMARLGAILRANHIALLVDATQALGRIPIDVASWGADYVAASAHKIYAPKGSGVLISRHAIQQDGLGTANVPGIAAFGKACELRRLEMDSDAARVAGIRDWLQGALTAALPSATVNGDPDRRLPGNISISVPGVESDVVIAALAERVALSDGAACSSGVDQPSHVLRAIGVPEELLRATLRIGVGRFNTLEEAKVAASLIIDVIRAMREP